MVEELTWEVNSPLAALDANPTAMGGGKRIFPGKTSPTDTVERNKVRVKARVSPVKAGVKVYFQGFDVDEPGTDAKPIDTNGSPSGGDNRSFNNKFRTVASSAETGVQELITNEQGIAVVEYSIGFQPGDNYRVAAHTQREKLTALTVAWNSGGSNDLFVSGSDAQLENFTGKLTEMLTVWRRLHVEVDSMGPVTGNTIAGQMTVRDNLNGTSTCTTNQTLNDASVQPGRFENGVLKDSAGQGFAVVSNTNGANFQVVVTNVANGAAQVSPAVGSFELVDDDPSHGGGNGDAVPLPNTSRLVELFKPAYIEVLFDGASFGWNQTNAPFHLNFPSISVSDVETIGKESRQSVSRPDFWATHCVGAFQPEKNLVIFMRMRIQIRVGMQRREHFLVEKPLFRVSQVTVLHLCFQRLR